MSKLEELTRPIIGIENRTAREVFDIMCDRITAALSAMPVPAVKVKPLEWKWVVGDVEVAGPYKLDRMRPWRPGKPKKYWVQVALGSGFMTIATLLPSLEAAKAAAQADYEARILSALTPAPDLAAENERLRAELTSSQKEIVLLHIAASMGGTFDSSDEPWNWLNWFCDDAGDDTDTFNRCNKKGWLRTTHDSDHDISRTVLTEAGRAALEDRT